MSLKANKSKLEHPELIPGSFILLEPQITQSQDVPQI